jgi:hypothetical protein
MERLQQQQQPHNAQDCLQHPLHPTPSSSSLQHSANRISNSSSSNSSTNSNDNSSTGSGGGHTPAQLLRRTNPRRRRPTKLVSLRASSWMVLLALTVASLAHFQFFASSRLTRKISLLDHATMAALGSLILSQVVVVDDDEPSSFENNNNNNNDDDEVQRNDDDNNNNNDDDDDDNIDVAIAKDRIRHSRTAAATTKTASVHGILRSSTNNEKTTTTN